jgi:hypothetical protein
MSITVVRTVKFNPCRTNFYRGLKNISDLDQYKKYIDFTSNNFTTSLIINDYCSVDELSKKIHVTSQQAKKYFYLAVNKFYIYSNTDCSDYATTDYENLLVDFCHTQIKDQFKLIDFTIGTDDRGQLGNFIHPATTLFFKRYE